MVDYELHKDAVIRDSQITASGGKRYLTVLSRLDVLIFGGYRVSSRHAPQSRKWVIQVLTECIVKEALGAIENIRELESTAHMLEAKLGRSAK